MGAASTLALFPEPSKAEAAPSSSLSIAAPAPSVDVKAIVDKAAKKALGGGKAGALAAVVQVSTLMWLRTAMNYQYRYGGTLGSSLRDLYGEGVANANADASEEGDEAGSNGGAATVFAGISRLYQGYPFALVQGPLTRFGDTAANVGVLALLESFPETASLPLALKTAAGSVAAGAWRIVLMPVDTSKTAMQVEGREGLDRLYKRVLGGEDGDGGIDPSPLYQGALASAAATAAGHFPWFLTYNFVSDVVPMVSKEEDLLLFLGRAAFLGLTASCVSDCVSNSLRVVKTTKQTAGLGEREDGESGEITYREALALIMEQDGLVGLFGRGLQTRLLTNAMQGAIFSVAWKYFQTT